MRVGLRLSVAVLAAPFALLAPGAEAQQISTSPVDGPILSGGGGIQFLWLPDIKFTGVGRPGNFRFQTNNDFTEYGPAADAKFETPIGMWGSYRVTGMVKGFWSNADDTDGAGCHGKCVVVDPGTGFTGSGPSLFTTASRDVDYWGGSLEAKFWSPNQVQVRPRLMRTNYFMLGADIRGLDQDNHLRGTSRGNSIFTYKEQLDTTYYGGYVGMGGEYSLGFLGTGGIWEALGLRSFFEARVGLYDADTDYRGNFAFQFTPVSSRSSLSQNELAFIGQLSFETRKQIGNRTSLSLWTDYEFISNVPEMRYSNGSRPTKIEDDWGFGSRTMLRLNIGLGSAPLYAESAPYEPIK
jgi:hypothetical protein